MSKLGSTGMLSRLTGPACWAMLKALSRVFSSALSRTNTATSLRSPAMLETMLRRSA
ncbi:hypothetical protein D3C77_686450 [compost metagenome]